MTTRRLNPFSSSRARMVIFITATLLIATTALYKINQRLEGHIIGQVEAHNRALTGALAIALESISSGEYLYKLVGEGRESRLPVNSQSIIRHILITDAAYKITDSTDAKDLGKQLQAAIGDLPPLSQGDIMRSADTNGNGQGSTMTLRVETTEGDRFIVIVVSLNQLSQVVAIAARDRLIAIAGLSLLLILIIAVFSRRFTRPITDLARAARRVAAGDLDFQVPVARRDEVGELSETFNEMLAGLRSKRELEEQLQRAERSAVVGRLASGIAHEIRNPLNFINLSIDHLREKFAPAGEAPRAEHARILGTIKDELGRLNRLVNDFLSYGRPARLKLLELDARTLIAEVMELVSAQAEEQGVSLRVQTLEGDEGHDRHGHLLRADAKQLKTCFSNLVINAIQAMPGGGELEITLRSEGPHLEISFADTGSGIAPEDITQIFEPYYSTKETGIGLGLPLTKKIIEDHGGQIAVASEPGMGATFIVTLPREPNSHPPSASTPQTALSAP
jgi:signal transduction histidine kinase